MHSPDRGAPRRWARPARLYLIALVPRLIFLLQWNRAGRIALPLVDAHTYDKEAAGLLAGSWPAHQPFWQAPLYSFFLAGVYRVAGAHWLAAWLANALLGAGICLLTWHLARRWLGERWALAAFAVAALYGPLIYFEGQLLREVLSTFLLLLWLLAVRRAREANTTLWWGLAGLLLGLASVCRENTLILAPLALWWCIRSAPAPSTAGAEAMEPAGRPPRRNRVPAATAFLLGLILALLPTTIFNWSREHDLIPISSSGGINFYLGNNAQSRQTIAIRPGRHWTDLVDRPSREAGARTALQESSFFYRQALRWITSHPAQFAGNTLYKTVGLLSAHEIKRNEDIYEGRQASWWLAALLWRAGPFGFPFGLLGPPALVGLWMIARGRRTVHPDALMLACAAAVFAFGIVLFFPNGRYRIPLIPILVLCAMHALATLGRWRREGAARPVWMEAAIVAVASVALVDGGWVQARDDPADQCFLRSTTLAEAERTDEAIAELRRAVAINPKHEEAWTTLAALYGKTGKVEEAVAAARTATSLDSTDAQAWVDLGTARLSAGDLPQAESDLRHALALQPDQADAWLNLGSLASGRGREEEAEADYRTALRFRPDLLDASRNLAQCLARGGRFDEGRAILDQALRDHPQDGSLWFALGNLEGRASRWGPAVEALGRAARIMPNNPDAWNNLGLALAQAGRRDEALRAFDRALALAPGHPQAAANRRRLIGS